MTHTATMTLVLPNSAYAEPAALLRVPARMSARMAERYQGAEHIVAPRLPVRDIMPPMHACLRLLLPLIALQ